MAKSEQCGGQQGDRKGLLMLSVLVVNGILGPVRSVEPRTVRAESDSVTSPWIRASCPSLNGGCFFLCL